MKKFYSSTILLFGTICISVVLFSCSGKKQQSPVLEPNTLMERKYSLSYNAEWANVKKRHNVLNENLKKNPSDLKSQIALVSLYINEARITGNFDYYHKVALAGIKKILEKDPENFEALTFKSTILLSEHQFAAGLEVAEKVKALYPYNAYVYGLITDAQVELGNYTAAIEAADQMVSLRPDIRSYSRIAYIREIHGDIPGAIEAMKLAIDAGAPGDENTEWCRMQLGKLYEQAGMWSEAESQYRYALENRMNYPPALTALAGISMEQKKYNEALVLYQQADSIVSDHSSMEGIAEVYELTGQKEKARVVRKEIYARMKKYAGDGLFSKQEGQNEDHEMAHACIGMGELDLALAYALTEYQRRPGNIEVSETVATVHALKRNYEQAVPYIENALRTNSKKPALLQLAEEIFMHSGKKDAVEKIQKEIATLHH